MLAPTIATVPVRVRVQGDQATCVFLKSLQDQATDMIAHEQSGLQRIAKMGQGPQHACGFQTLLVVQPADDGLDSDNTLGEWRDHSGLQEFTTYALMVQCTLAKDRVEVTASFDARVIEQWVVEKILRQFSFIMQQLAEASEDSKPSFNAFIQYLSQQDPEAAAAYWQTALVDCEAVLFPPLPSTVTQPVADTTVEYQCPPLIQSATDITTSTLVRAAWAIVTSRYTSSDDVVFGTTVTGRNAPIAGVEAMVGPMIATVPVRLRVQRDQTVFAFLQGLQQQATDMIAHEQTGLQRIAKMSPGARHACGFQTLLVVQPADDVLSSDDTLGEWRGHSELQDFTTRGKEGGGYRDYHA
ncbi:hypothetical protein PTNB29_02543 [Pyrenophora teres f. teres]|nr:hypothetical protein PTNB29_02543 [Pyrenophora teres f. teres]